MLLVLYSINFAGAGIFGFQNSKDQDIEYIRKAFRMYLQRQFPDCGRSRRRKDEEWQSVTERSFLKFTKVQDSEAEK